MSGGQELCGMREKVSGGQKDTDMPFHVDRNRDIVILENSTYYITCGWVVPDLNIKLRCFGSCLEGGCRKQVNDRTCMLL